jgi:hypothetical protein
MVFFSGLKIYGLIEEHGHRVLHIRPHHGHFNPTELEWSQIKRYYNGSLDHNGFGIEAVKIMWKELLEQIYRFF